jgi:hypothetical protein
MDLNQLHFRLPDNHIRPPMTISLRQKNVTRAPAYFVHFADCTFRRALTILYSVIDAIVTPFHPVFRPLELYPPISLRCPWTSTYCSSFGHLRARRYLGHCALHACY